MNLGLESLYPATTKQSAVSFEQFCIGTLNAADELMEATNQLGQALDTVSHLQEIGCAVERFGYTQSIDYLFGSNFGGVVSAEGIKEFSSKVWEGIKAFFRKIAEALRAIWNYFFGNADKMLAKVEQRVKDIESKGVVERKVKIPFSTILGKIYKLFQSELKPLLAQCAEQVKKLSQQTSDGSVESTFLKVAEEITSGTFDWYEGLAVGVGDDDNVTLNKQFAVGYGKMVCAFLREVIALKPLVKTVTENFTTLAKASITGGVAAAKKEGADANVADKTGQVLTILLESPQGKEAVKKICTFINKQFNKATRICIVAGGAYLSQCKPGKGDNTAAPAEPEKA